MRFLGWLLRGVVALVLIALVLLFAVVPAVVDWRANLKLTSPPYEGSAEAREILARSTVADMHADTLLWSRDPAKRYRRGLVDIPRLIEGGVALQGFTIVTKVPITLSIETNSADSRDLIGPLAILQRWPRATWESLSARALHQAMRLQAAAHKRDDFFLIRTREDLADYLALREQRRDVTAGYLGIEGAHALEGKLENVDVMFQAGVRMMAPTHFFDTELAGSAHGEVKGGLTPLGRRMIARMEEIGMLLDLAHASPTAFHDAMAIATKPVVVSHTGVKGTCDNPRNLDDSMIREIAGSHGVVGIGYWETAVCGTDAAAIARAIRYVVDLVGIDAVGLGSDFDGAIAAPFDTTGLVLVVDALLAEGFSDGEIGKIMGGNTLRVLAQVLPQRAGVQ